MKKLIISSLIVALAEISSISANSYHHKPEEFTPQISENIVPLSELTQELAEDFFMGNPSSFILECTEGTILPFSLSLKGEFLALTTQEVPQTIQVLKTCYIKQMDETFLFSIDLQHWKEFQDFFTGSVGASLNFQESIPTVGFNIELNQKT